MKSTSHSFVPMYSRRLWMLAPFLVGLAVLAVSLWSAWLGLHASHDGVMAISPAGMILKADEFGMQVNDLRPGDVIVAVDGEALSGGSTPVKRPGDHAEYLIQREGELVRRNVRLTEAPASLVLNYLAIALVALSFCLVGTGLQLFNVGDRVSVLFFVFSQASSLVIATGLASGFGSAWASQAFRVLVWLIGPLAVHLHMHFPQAALGGRRGVLAAGLYSLGAAGASTNMIWPGERLIAQSWYAQSSMARMLFLGANLVMVMALLVWGYRHASSAGVRSKIRIVVLGGVMALTPIVCLSILPEVILGAPILDYELTLLALGIAPLTYGYAIARHRLIHLDRYVNRGASIVLVYSSLGGLYMVLYSLLHQIAPAQAMKELVINTLVVLTLVSIYVPLRWRVQRLVDIAFYGGWYDYRSAIAEITHGLEPLSTLEALAATVGQRLVATLRLERAAVMLRDTQGVFSAIAIAPEANEPPVSSLPRDSFGYLRETGLVDRSALQRRLKGTGLSTEERRLLSDQQVDLLAPVIAHEKLLGVLALGSKLGGDMFSGEDLDILQAVARQLGPLIENIHLLNQLRQHANELEQRVIERTAEFHAQKERAEAILSSVGDGVYVTDLDGAIHTVNQALEVQSGFSAKELIGRKLYTWIDSQGEDNPSDAIRTALEAQQTWSGDLVAQRRDGQRYFVHLTITPVRDEAGQLMGFVGSQRDITDRKRLEDHLHHAATHDPLTGIPNRVLFAQRLEQALAWAAPSRMGVAVFFLDLDGFKAINDGFGHENGDRSLKLIAERLHTCTRKTDTLARLGGDEFGLVCPGVDDPSAVKALAEKILQAVAEPLELDGQRVSISASIGVSQFPEDGRDPEELLKKADSAMYAVKGRHKNGFRMFAGELAAS